MKQKTGWKFAIAIVSMSLIILMISGCEDVKVKEVPSIEETSTEETLTEETLTEEPSTEESSTEEPSTEEPSQEVATTEVVSTQVPKDESELKPDTKTERWIFEVLQEHKGEKKYLYYLKVKKTAPIDIEKCQKQAKKYSAKIMILDFYDGTKMVYVLKDIEYKFYLHFDPELCKEGMWCIKNPDHMSIGEQGSLYQFIERDGPDDVKVKSVTSGNTYYFSIEGVIYYTTVYKGTCSGSGNKS